MTVSRPRIRRQDGQPGQLEQYLNNRQKHAAIIVRCNLDGCNWAKTTTAQHANGIHDEHRTHAHPELQPRTRRQVLADWRNKR